MSQSERCVYCGMWVDSSSPRVYWRQEKRLRRGDKHPTMQAEALVTHIVVYLERGGLVHPRTCEKWIWRGGEVGAVTGPTVRVEDV